VSTTRKWQSDMVDSWKQNQTGRPKLEKQKIASQLECGLSKGTSAIVFISNSVNNVSSACPASKSGKCQQIRRKQPNNDCLFCLFWGQPGRETMSQPFQSMHFQRKASTNSKINVKSKPAPDQNSMKKFTLKSMFERSLTKNAKTLTSLTKITCFT